jgi:hypothetical protein
MRAKLSPAYRVMSCDDELFEIQRIGCNVSRNRVRNPALFAECTHSAIRSTLFMAESFAAACSNVASSNRPASRIQSAISRVFGLIRVERQT